MEPWIVAQHRAAAWLVGRRVRFRHEPAGATYRVTHAALGMVRLEGLETGAFAPQLLEPVEDEKEERDGDYSRR